MARKLASVRRVLNIEPIPNADRIELAHIDGWQVIVKKDEIHIGDNVIYFEIDSWIPTELAPFLTKQGSEPHEFNGVKGERLKTIKMRGTLSQGLILPLSVLKERNPEVYKKAYDCIGYDLTEALGIQKWEMPEVEQRRRFGSSAVAPGDHRYPFPDFIPKTDQERIQNMPEIFEEAIDSREKTSTYQVTEKLDGTSCTICLYDDGTTQRFLVCSRNYIYQPDGGQTVYGEIVKKYNIKRRLSPWNWIDKVLNFFGIKDPTRPIRKEGWPNLAIQGEIIGPKVQGNKYNLEELEFYVFDIFDIRNQVYLTPAETAAITLDLGLEHVPLIDGAWELNGQTMESVIKMAEGKTVVGNNPDQEREGLVFKRNNIRRKSFKAISNKFLLSLKEK